MDDEIYLTLRLTKSFGGDKYDRGLIPDGGSCPLSTQLKEDRLWHAIGPVQPSVPLHWYLYSQPKNGLIRTALDEWSTFEPQSSSWEPLTQSVAI